MFWKSHLRVPLSGKSFKVTIRVCVIFQRFGGVRLILLSNCLLHAVLTCAFVSGKRIR